MKKGKSIFGPQYVSPTIAGVGVQVIMAAWSNGDRRKASAANRENKQEAQLSQRDRARFVSLTILLSHSIHSSSFVMTLLSRVYLSPY